MNSQFQHTAARRRLDVVQLILHTYQSFNTQPPEGGWTKRKRWRLRIKPFQHTAARRRLVVIHNVAAVNAGFQHTAARRRLAVVPPRLCFLTWFQHTAARRRLADLQETVERYQEVSTHSRPKAAGCKWRQF